MRPELEESLLRALPECLRLPVRFVLSTEIHCAPRRHAGTRWTASPRLL
jgi:hypothetical protein